MSSAYIYTERQPEYLLHIRVLAAKPLVEDMSNSKALTAANACVTGLQENENPVRARYLQKSRTLFVIHSILLSLWIRLQQL